MITEKTKKQSEIDALLEKIAIAPISDKSEETVVKTKSDKWKHKTMSQVKTIKRIIKHCR